MSGDLNNGDNTMSNVADIIFTTNSIVMFTGEILGTNYLGLLDGTNVYRIKFPY